MEKEDREGGGWGGTQEMSDEEEKRKEEQKNVSWIKNSKENFSPKDMKLKAKEDGRV